MMALEVPTSAWLDLKHDLWRVCFFIAFNALLANFLPAAARFRRWRRFCAAYVLFVDVVAFFGLSWRAQRPCLEFEFMGFRRRRFWRQLHEAQRSAAKRRVERRGKR